VRANLTRDRSDALALIKQQHIAVTPHEFKHQGALGRLSRSRRQLKVHDPFKSFLMELRQRQLAESMLNLLRQSASRTLLRWRRNFNQPGNFCFPAQFQPNHSSQSAKAKLKRLRIGLLRFLKTAWQQPGT
jgi:hypothetical protein